MIRRLVPLACAAALALPCPAALRAQEPAAKAQKSLTELVRPFANLDERLRPGPVKWPAPAALEQPALAPPLYRGGPPTFPPPTARKPVRPGPLDEGTPLASYRPGPEVPQPPELPTEPLVRLISEDVREPLPLPALAEPAKDRASLADPTLEASIAAALRAFTPSPRGPLPFMPLNLPDPFEHARAGRLRYPPDEDVQPPPLPAPTPEKKN